MKNRYEIRGEVAVIFCPHPSTGTTIEVRIDTEMLPVVQSEGSGKCWTVRGHLTRPDTGPYTKPAVSVQGYQKILLPRLILGLAPGKVATHVRYRNGDLFDCRRENISLTTDPQHVTATQDQMEAAYERLHRPLLAFLFKRGWKDRVVWGVDAEDIVHDAFLILFRHPEFSSRAPETLVSLAFKITDDAALDVYKKQSRERWFHRSPSREGEDGAADEDGEMESIPDSRSEQDLDSIPDRILLDRVREAVSPYQFSLLWQVYGLTLTCATVAEKQGIPPTTLFNRLSTARKKARAALVA